MSEEEQTEVTQTTEVVDSSVIEAVRKQIEYYFSKENLQTDVYLQSQMDAQKAVPISVVMKFAKLKALTTDEAVVRQALVDSAVTIVDNKIKANLKASGRCTIILRDIPADTPEEEVREIFNYEGCKPISSLRSDIGDTWFVNMEEEEDAKQTLLDLRLKKRTFRGASVKGRIKTEQVVRSYYAVPPAPLMGPIPPMGGMPFPPMPFPIPGGVNAEGIVLPPFPYMVPALGSDPNAPSFYPDGSAESFEGEAAADANESVDGTVPGSDENANEEKNKKAGDAKGRGDSRSKTSTSRTGAKTDSSSTKGRSDRKAGTGAASTGRKSEQVTAASITATSKPPVEINAINFPPLFAHDDTPAPTPGYKEDYRKYTIDDVIAIVKTSVFDATLPAEVNAAEHSYAMGTEANLDLLKRQRTFTIDETREQLRQGRPASSGLLSGAVDYRSLHYGDDTGVHHFHHLSTIEEKNEALNASVDAINASQLDMSTVDAALNESYVEQPASTSAQAAGLASPARISAASWAALVKSAAPVEASTASAPVVTTSSAASTTTASAPRKSASTTTATKSAGNNKSTAENNKKSENKKDDKKKNVAASSSSNHKDSKDSNNKQPQQKQPSSRKPATEPAAATSEESKDGSAVETTASTGPAWGGKSSFASVLKQKTGDDEATATTAKSTAAPAVSSSRRNPSNSTATTSKANSSNNNKEGSPFRSSNGHFRRTNASSTGAAAGASSNASVDGGSVEGGAPKKIPVAEDGMWVKETLPPWTGGNKHAKNASDSA